MSSMIRPLMQSVGTERRVTRSVWLYFFGTAVGIWLFALSPATAAKAADNIITREIPLTATDFVSPVAVPKFNTQLGALQRVEISFSSRLEGSVRFESLDASETLVTTEMAGWLELIGPDGVTLASANPRTSRSILLAPFDGALDYSGLSGGVFPQLVAADLAETTVLDTPEELALFSGPGQIQMTVKASGSVSGQGGGNLSLVYDTAASATITVKYIFQAALNPAIDLEKATNGEDADLATGPLIPVDEKVTWTYVIRNTGDTPLVDVQLVDDEEGTVRCPQTTLAVGESMTCTLEGVARLGQYANMATVTAQTPADPTIPVTDTDPSHYYGIPITTVCPVDLYGVLELPKVTYLGEGSGSYILPAGYDLFVVKRFSPFRFVVEPGVAVGDQQHYTAQSSRERVWACAGDCQFPQALHGAFPIGRIGPGITMGAVVIDDDDDNRVNAWIADGDTANPYQTIDNQMMVQELVLDIPFEADWSFYANDSIGLLYTCLAPTTGVRAARIWGEGYASPQPEELNETGFAHRVFLPITRN
ncbi:MAG: hypothetical protein DCC55_23945 [Chloroflexi bacterium]|nr:MAG: hypothetical protein DCC55_23945 [Chloroflexota bacterium]